MKKMFLVLFLASSFSAEAMNSHKEKKEFISRKRRRLHLLPKRVRSDGQESSMAIAEGAKESLPHQEGNEEEGEGNLTKPNQTNEEPTPVPTTGQKSEGPRRNQMIVEEEEVPVQQPVQNNIGGGGNANANGGQTDRFSDLKVDLQKIALGFLTTREVERNMRGLNRKARNRDLHKPLTYQTHLSFPGSTLTRERLDQIFHAVRDRANTGNPVLCLDFRGATIQGTYGLGPIYLNDLVSYADDLTDNLPVIRVPRVNLGGDVHRISRLVPHLDVLDLSHNLLREAGVRALAGALQHVPNLHTLDLSWNHLGDAGGQALADVLQQRVPNLHTLNLSHNLLGDAGVRALAGALQHVLNLHTLNLSHNLLGDAGVRALAEALQNNPMTNLHTLDLSWNFLREAGVRALAEALQNNPMTNLRTLDFSGNSLRNEGVQALAGVLRNIPTLQHLNLQNLGVTEEGRENIRNALTGRNVDIQF